jgi:S1-C subfamily serine protease
MVAGRLALAVPSNAVANFLAADPIDAWLGVTVAPVQVPRPGSRAKTFGLVLLEVEPESPAANASLMPGDILLGTDEKSFASVDDLASALQGSGPRLVRLAFLRGNYERFRRVTVQLGGQRFPRSAAAA